MKWSVEKHGMCAINLGLLLLGGVFALWSCSDFGDKVLRSPDASLTWQSDIWPQLHDRCISCHSGSTPSGGFSIANFDAWIHATSSSGNPYVVAGNPDSSELVWRIEGSNGLQRMPATGDPLPSATIQRVRNWISEGAAKGSGNP